MTALESLASLTWMTDINAQPTMFTRSFFETWDSPPHDFSLDLYAFVMAREQGLRIERFPVTFAPRGAGVGHNDTLAAKLRYSRRTLGYSLELRRRLRGARH